MKTASPGHSLRTLAARAVLAASLLALLTHSSTAQIDPGDLADVLAIGSGSGGFGGQLDPGDEFGAALAQLGDLDGNGVIDQAVGAPGDDDGGPGHGAVWVLFMAADGSVAGQQKISELAGGFGGSMGNNHHFGQSLGAVGDLDGDGLPELAVGVPRDKDGGSKHGAVWILFLNPDGSVRDDQKISETAGGFGGHLDNGDEFGTSVAGLGDVDGDGVPDLAVGAVNDDDGHSQNGAVWILFLNPDGSVREETKISASSGLPLPEHAGFGRALARLGDLDGNGVADLAASSFQHDDDDDDDGDDDGDDDDEEGDDDDGDDDFTGVAGGGDPGVVWVLFLAPDGSVLDQQQISTNQGGFGGTLSKGDGFGAGLAGAGDLDGDGVADLLVGAPGDDDGGTDRGAGWILFLQSDGSVAAERKYSAETEPLLDALSDGDAFGSSLVCAGDLDGDGAADILSGSPGAQSGQGGAWLMLLAATPQEDPYSPSASIFDGRPGRSFLVGPAQGAPGFEDFIDEPVVVVTNASGATLTVHLGVTNPGGDVNFSENNLADTGSSPLDGESGDFTLGTGLLGQLQDLVIANFGSDSFSFLAGLPDGSFAPQVQHSLLPLNAAPIAIEKGDFDGDGLLDVALAGNAGVSVFLGDGAGGFPVSLFTPVPLLTDLRVGLVDGDAILDLVATSGRVVTAGQPSEEGFATVLIGAGDGSFRPTGTFASGTALASVLLDDIDRDGMLDALIAAHSFAGGPDGEPVGHIDLYLGDGTGGFTPSPLFAGFAQPSAQGIHPLFGALGDLDGDGWLDAVYSSNANISHPAGDFADEQPPVVLTVLHGDGVGGFDVNEVGTAYAGKGVAPILADIFEDAAGNPDAILVWYEDAAAGLGGGEEDFTTFLTAFSSDGEASFLDPSPQQFDTGDEPTNGALADLDTGGTGRIDIVVPNLLDDSLTLLLGNGEGGIRSTLTLTEVGLFTPDDLPPGNWLGGPRAVATGELDGDGQLDAVVYSAFTDTSLLAPDPSAFASLSVVHFAGAEVVQRLALPRGGELAFDDLNGDGRPDAVVTQRIGPGGPDQLLVYASNAAGLLHSHPHAVAIPPGLTLSGGLLLADLDGDGLPELLTSAIDDGSGDGSLLVLDAAGGPPTTVSMGTSWSGVRSLALGDVGGDGLPDVLLGLDDGSLLLAEGTGPGSFAPAPLDPQAASVGGGSIALADVNGDGRLDVISSTSVDDGSVDQAFVRVLLGTASGVFNVQNVDALQSTGLIGALDPLLADMNGDGAVDLVLVHGTSDRLSILINQLSSFEEYGAGKPGSGGLVPHLQGQGFTNPGGHLSVQLSAALGGAPGLLLLGVGQEPGGFLHVKTSLLEVPVTATGDAAQAGEGSFSVPLEVPDDAGLVGVQITLQALLFDPGAGPPAPNQLAASNGLAVTIVQ